MEEMRALEKNGIWDLVSFPRGKTQVRCKWVFTIKHKVDGSVERYKARLVAKDLQKLMALIIKRRMQQLPRQTQFKSYCHL